MAAASLTPLDPAPRAPWFLTTPATDTLILTLDPFVCFEESDEEEEEEEEKGLGG
jgi:hypothetical protein